MRVALVYPPVADATQPYSSLPALAAFLRRRGRHEVVLHDANVDYVGQMLMAERLEEAASKVAAAAPRSRAALVAPIARDEIDGAVAALRSHDTFSDLARLDRAKRVLHDASDVLRASASPLDVEWTAAGIDAVARDRRRNPFFAFLRDVTLPRLAGAKPQAVGISITYRNQVLPAVTLALLVKRRLPRVPVIFGGQIPSVWFANGRSEVFAWCDYLVPNEGEAALDALLSALESGAPVERVVQSAPEEIDALPPPDYSDLPLDRYLSPEPVFLLNASRGCYWSKCEFCSVSPSMRGCFRMRAPELVLDDIAALQARHGARCIAFGDDCVPPRMLAALSRGLRARAIDVSWQCEARFEPRFTAALLDEMRESGCRNLIFGLESYVPRVLQSMKKGVRHAGIARILDDCRRSGIAFNLQLFFGFPGETEEEGRQTLDFVLDQLRGAATASCGTFRLQRGSGVAADPAAFGIAPADDREPLSIDVPYEPVPPHAEALRQALEAAVSRRAAFRSLPLGLDAHTLLYLRRAGVDAMASQYWSATPGATPIAVDLDLDAKLAASGRQTIAAADGTILLYDHAADRAVEISCLAQWLLEQLDQPRSPRQIARRLADASGEGDGDGELLEAVTAIAGDLLQRGFLQAIAGEPARPTA